METRQGTAGPVQESTFVIWAAPQVPFVAPFLVFVAVTWPLPRESAETMRFQEQASQIVLVL